jgi:hypothetical protein
LGRGHPRFRPDFSCPALLTIPGHPQHPPLAYRALTVYGTPFQRVSAHVAAAGEDAAAHLHQTRPTPHGHRRQAVPPAGFGLLPLRSPLLRESSLLLGVLRCFSSPGALDEGRPPSCPAVRRAGCPIRKPPDPRLPAPPRSISPRGRVLPRPSAPRHPPCTRSRGCPLQSVPGQLPQTAPDRRAPARTSPPSVAHRPPPPRQGAQTGPARSHRATWIISTRFGYQNHCRSKSLFIACSARGRPGMMHRPESDPGSAHPPVGCCPSILPRPPDRSGPAWRIVKVLLG